MSNVSDIVDIDSRALAEDLWVVKETEQLQRTFNKIVGALVNDQVKGLANPIWAILSFGWGMQTAQYLSASTCRRSTSDSSFIMIWLRR